MIDLLGSDKEVSPMPPLEGNKKVEGKGIKIFTPNKLLTRLPVSLAQIIAGNNSYKLKNEIIQNCIFCIRHNKVTKTLYNNLIKSL